ncbi:hypothetical protein Barb4_02380 [Bacteroidales bacterium Barb4]|nr:hypothetical protein Barb4_02380 [Bacteroidales bacterium Barb4]
MILRGYFTTETRRTRRIHDFTYIFLRVLRVSVVKFPDIEK